MPATLDPPLTEPGVVTQLLRARGSCSTQADTKHIDRVEAPSQPASPLPSDKKQLMSAIDVVSRFKDLGAQLSESFPRESGRETLLASPDSNTGRGPPKGPQEEELPLKQGQGALPIPGNHGLPYKWVDGTCVRTQIETNAHMQ
ncbi:hypothetical protein JOQ06_003166, partial [Pogonophryne albipinna]